MLSLSQASKIVDAALSKARELELRPLTVTVLDPGGHALVVKREDGAGPPAVGLAVPTFSLHPERDPGCQARDRDPLAPSRLSSLLALEISPGRRPATDRR